MSAPRVIAKGTDLIALRIRELAEENGIPALEMPPLARSLTKHVDIGREIPFELYSAVAEVLAWAFAVKKAQSGQGLTPPEPRTIPIPDDYEVPAS